MLRQSSANVVMSIFNWMMVVIFWNNRFYQKMFSQTYKYKYKVVNSESDLSQSCKIM